ncbi:ShlB/FhaC/HecB family hemolysin secretion/activation protein [Ralstonia syzygii subsp. celebesensis]|uniref:ShlB/FhaC/HecB family hemolysin secretion/activation protein n=1 Tax=Ralstonia syzygii TaxID=28097 RepID=UPI00387E0E74
MNAAAARITAYYREQGYPVTRAYLPTQEVADGKVTIAVVEGRIGAHRLNNRSRLSDVRAGAYLDMAKEDEVIRSAPIDRGLLILNDTPGVGTARATLQPGASVGTSDLVMELTPGAAYSGSIDLDNYGNRYVGEYRLGGTLNINSPLRIGDVLSLNALSSGNGLSYGRAAYQLPVGSDGLRLGTAYSYTVYKLGKEFKTLDAHGKASSASVFAVYPFIRSQQTNLNGTISLEQKNLSDSVDSTLTTTDKRVKLAAIGLQGTHLDGMAGGGLTSASLTATFGNLNIQSPSAVAIDAASAQTNGRYTRLAYNLGRLQRLSDSDSLSLSVSGQEASKNLDSSEKFSLGEPPACAPIRKAKVSATKAIWRPPSCATTLPRRCKRRCSTTLARSGSTTRRSARRLPTAAHCPAPVSVSMQMWPTSEFVHRWPGVPTVSNRLRYRYQRCKLRRYGCRPARCSSQKSRQKMFDSGFYQLGPGVGARLAMRTVTRRTLFWRYKAMLAEPVGLIGVKRGRWCAGESATVLESFCRASANWLR